MVSEELKLRISSLCRTGVGSRTSGRGVGRRGRREHADLRECFPEGRVLNTDQGDAFVCEASLREMHSDAQRLIDSYRGAFDAAARLAGADALPHYLELLVDTDPARAALIDTETAGLHGRPLFMIGLALYRDDDLMVTQYFARDYAEEAAILHRFANLLPELDLLISFNGKAFDWPFVRDRMVYHRVSCRPGFAHLDLLHPSRRRWRRQLPNCKLSTLERYLCGRWRTDDIPGEQIPGRYHEFVREQDARLVAPIFHHNRLDLVTMIELLAVLVGGEDGTSSPSRGAAARTTARGGTAGGRGAKERSR